MAQLSRFQVEDLTLGMNNVDDPWELRPGESSSLSNVIPVEGGHVIAARNGVQTLGTGLGATGRIENLYYWAAKDLILVSHAGNIWSAPASTGTLNQRRVGTAGDFIHPWCFEVMKNSVGVEMLYMVNGIDTPQVWAGDTATTGAWGAGVPPAGCTWIRLWKNRMVAGGNAAFPERIYYSDIGNPHSPNPYHFVDLRSAYDDTDVTSWSELVGDNLIVFKPNSTWLVYDSNTFASRRLGFAGCPHPFMSIEFRNRVYFMSATGLYSTNGEEEPVAEPRKLTYFDLEEATIVLNGVRMVMDYREERILIIIPVVNVAGAPGTPGSRPTPGDAPSFFRFLLYYPPQTRNNPHKEGTYFVFTFSPQMTSATFIKRGRDPGNELVLGSSTANGQLFRGFLNTLDGANAISATWETGWLRLHAEERYERVRRINLRGSSGSALTFKLKSPLGADLFTSSKALSSTGLTRVRPEIRAQHHKLEVSGPAPWTLRDIELVFRGGKEH